MPSLIGNKPNQVPTNGDLGKLAFQDGVVPAGDIVGTTATQTLTNKTINASQLVDASVTSAKLATQTSIPFATGSLGAGNASIMKNRIINGAMVIDQRNAGASVTINTTVPFIADRWNGYSDLANMTGQRTQATVPVNFTYALGVTVGTGASPTAGQISRLEQRIEGFNFADLYWGGANAQTITMSFWVRSSITGTHSGALANLAGTASYPYTFVINSANTWEYKTITITGSTTGVWATDNTTGCIIRFNLGTGSTYLTTGNAWAGGNYFGVTGSVQLATTTGATFYITGVQLEVGSSATGYEYRQYQQELALCQRYYQQYGSYFAVASAGQRVPVMILPVTMRSTPSMTSGLVNNIENGSTLIASPTYSVETADGAAWTNQLTGSAGVFARITSLKISAEL